MYEIKPQPIKSYIEDSSIKLPRFQRKKTWSPEKNFLFAVSIFKGYPLGVSILNIEKERNGGNVTKWLLDGRQRMNALKEMYYDPEKIYYWARRYVKFKNNDQPNEVIDKFVEKVNEYIELDENTISETENDIEQEEAIDITQDDDNITEELRNSGLQLLGQLISLTHNVKTKCTGLSKPFDFSKFFNNVYYIEADGKINSKKVKSTMGQYKDYCKDNDIDYAKKESFISFFESRYSYKDDNKGREFKSQIDFSWSDILKRINLFDEVDKLFLSASIGLIEVSDITVTDSQKIFNIINDGGTKLTAAEILSAKPSWNIKVNNPTESLIDATRNLYKKIDVSNDGVVRWDLPATFIKRLNNKDFIFGDFNDDSTGFEKEVGLGFKLLAGVYEKGIKKDDISKLSINSSIKWSSDIESLIIELSDLFKLISENKFFKYLRSWKTSLRVLTSDAVMLNFILLTRLDWLKKDKSTTDNNAKKVQKNAYILFDRLIYEYTTRQWRGSSDSKISKNIDKFSSLQGTDGMFEPIAQDKWDKLILEIIENNKVEDEIFDQQAMTPILYYYYCLKGIAGPNDVDTSIEVDHIIPQTKFDNSTINGKENIKHNLFNLALMPKKDNISKNNKTLKQIDDSWLKSQISLYEEIEPKDFEKFSDINNYNDLRKLRGEKFKDIFNRERQSHLNN